MTDGTVGPAVAGGWVSAFGGRCPGYPARVACGTPLALCLLLFPLASYVRAASDPPPRVAIEAAGNDRGVWLIRSAPRNSAAESHAAGAESRLNVVAWMAVGGARLEPAAIAPEVGRILRWTASGPYLFVFFDDGTHRSYSRDARGIEIDLPERAVPLAIAGMTGERSRPRVGLYAVVRHRIGLEIIRREREAAGATRPTTAPAASRHAPTGPAGPTLSADAHSSATDAPSTATAAPPETLAIEAAPVDTRALDLVAYEGGRWRYVAPIEGLADDPDAARFWLCASPQAIYVFHATGGPDDIRAVDCLFWQDGRWAKLPGIDLEGRLGCGAAMYLEPRAAFAAGLRGGPRAKPPSAGGVAVADTRDADSPAADAGGAAVLWRVWSLVDNRWQMGSPFDFESREGGSPEPVPGGSAVAALGQNVFLAAFDRAGEIEVGIWPSEGGAPKRRLEVTKVFELPRRPLIDPRTRDWLGLFVVLAVIAAVFWKRQDSLTTPARLPRDLALAAYWKRLVAAILDLLPAAVLTGWIWYAPLAAYYDDLVAASAAWKDTVPPAPDALLMGWLVLRIVYAAYCASFERLWGATPGKRLLGCRVLNETGEPPSMRDVLIRNIMRILELEPYLPIWPLVLIIFFTRNRQRLGDLFARTVVVEPARPVSRPDPDDDLP